MSRTKQLKRISGIAKNDELAAGKKLVNLRNEHEKQNHQLGQLIQYQDDYSSQLAKQAGDGIPSRQLRNYNTFLGNLGKAINQQKTTVESSQQNLNHGHQQWLYQHQRAKTLTRVSEKHQQQEQSENAKREQSEVDELISKNTNSAIWED